MILGTGSRKLLLAAHLTVSVGWIGAAGAYLALDVTGATSTDAATIRAVHVSMELIATSVIVPLAFASLVTGVAVSLRTKWGLFRHYWVVVSLVLTAAATVVLVLETRTIAHLADVASDPRTSADALRGLASTLPHSIGGIVVLVVILVLNVYKPRGLTPYGWRRQRRERAGGSTSGP